MANAPIINNNPGQLFGIPGPNPSGTPSGVFQHDSDYSLITSENPAISGENVTLYGTGFSYLNSIPPDGAPASANPLSQVTPVDMPGFGILDAFTIFVDGTTDVTPEFMGLTPGAVGLGQINFVVPPLSSGTHQVQIKQSHRVISMFQFPNDIYLSKPVLLYVK